MSGHSKWATIKRAKGVNDAKRGQLFTKLANAITISVKQGGGVTDIEMNPSLRIAVDKAKGANMPRENIDRAIQRAAGLGQGVEFTEALYEGFAPGGVGMLIEAVTDKKQRTVAEVKNLIEKSGGSLGSQGSVSYQFQKAGEIIVKADGKSSDEILSVALDSGVEDLEDAGEVVFLYTSATSLMQVKEALEKAGLIVEEAGLIYKPMNRLQVDSVVEEKVMAIVEKLEDLDDVQKVYTNMEHVE